MPEGILNMYLIKLINKHLYSGEESIIIHIRAIYGILPEVHEIP